MEKLIQRCDVCKGIEMPDGSRLRYSQYNERALRERGFSFTDATRSKRCVDIWLARQSIPEDMKNNLREVAYKNAKYGECPR